MRRLANAPIVRSSRLAAARLGIIGLVALCCAAMLVAQEPAAVDSPPRIAAPKSGGKPAAVKRSRRLPPFYSRVVNSTQRLAIYDIQDKYQLRVDALQSQIDALRGEMTAEIDRLLSPQQLKLLADLKQQARRPPQVVAKPLDPPPSK